jgi:hypothetical protein
MMSDMNSFLSLLPMLRPLITMVPMREVMCGVQGLLVSGLWSVMLLPLLPRMPTLLLSALLLPLS